jgi:hypothetical protein
MKDSGARTVTLGLSRCAVSGFSGQNDLLDCGSTHAEPRSRISAVLLAPPPAVQPASSTALLRGCQTLPNAGADGWVSSAFEGDGRDPVPPSPGGLFPTAADFRGTDDANVATATLDSAMLPSAAVAWIRGPGFPRGRI